MLGELWPPGPRGAVTGLLIKEAVAVIRRFFHSAAAVSLSRRPDPELFRLLVPSGGTGWVVFLAFGPSLHSDQRDAAFVRGRFTGTN